MAASPAPSTPSEPVKLQVAPLSTTAFYSIITNIWKNSGVRELFINYAYYVTANNEAEKIKASNGMSVYFNRIDKILNEMLEWKIFPKPMLIKLGNCFLEHDRNAREFSISLISGLVDCSMENVRICVNNIVVTPEGIIDKRQTIMNISLMRERDVKFERCYTAYYCIGQEQIRKIIKEREESPSNEEENDEDIEQTVSDFGDPLTFWEAKSLYVDMENLFYECIASHGSPESLEYFLNTIEVAQRQKALSKAAIYMVTMRCMNMEKVLFFHNHMDHPVWVEFLRRHFYNIIAHFLDNRRYRHLCTGFFYQVVDILDNNMNFCLIDFIATEFMAVINRSVYQVLYLEDMEAILTTVWYITPVEHKRSFGSTIFRVINKLLFSNRYNMVATIIHDEIFDLEERTEIVSCVIMNMIVHNKADSIGVFLKKLNPGTCNATKISDHITYDNLKVYIMLSDNCKHVGDYDKIMEYKFATISDMKTMKRNLLVDKEFVTGVINGIKESVISIDDFHKLLLWCFCNYIPHVYGYTEKYLLPEHHLTTIYKNYLLGTRTSFYRIDCFQLTDSQVQVIRKTIASDYETLFEYCANLLYDKDYKNLPRMLTSVFQNQTNREHFLTNFFNSTRGMHAVYNLILDETYDETLYTCFKLHNKLREFIKFRKNWLISDDVCLYLEGLLQQYGHPNADDFSMEIQMTHKLLPHESVEAMRTITDANYRMFMCLLHSPVLVDFLNEMEMMRNAPVTQITELSVMYELQAGIHIPVII